MTNCCVICHQCRDDHGNPKRYRSLCVECSETFLDQHRRHTGHNDLELRVTDEITIEQLRTKIGRTHNYWTTIRQGRH